MRKYTGMCSTREGPALLANVRLALKTCHVETLQLILQKINCERKFIQASLLDVQRVIRSQPIEAVVACTINVLQ